MSVDEHLQEARKLHQKAVQELDRAKEREDSSLLRDSCAKGWLSAVEATYGPFGEKNELRLRRKSFPR